MTDLFDLPPSLSPRLLWMEKHGIEIEQESDPKLGNFWWAWSTKYSGEDPDSAISMIGDTEEDAVFQWARMHGVPLWNEEGGAG